MHVDCFIYYYSKIRHICHVIVSYATIYQHCSLFEHNYRFKTLSQGRRLQRSALVLGVLAKECHYRHHPAAHLSSLPISEPA
uniref:Uncharacterized protein n=1 Tax=Solanum tuberosum TaxID=4113 RepID=M1BST3_SOLTU